MAKLYGTKTCEKCGHAFKWIFLLRQRFDKHIEVERFSTDTIEAHSTCGGEDNPTELACYCPSCGVIIRIPSTEFCKS